MKLTITDNCLSLLRTYLSPYNTLSLCFFKAGTLQVTDSDKADIPFLLKKQNKKTTKTLKLEIVSFSYLNQFLKNPSQGA